MSTILTEEAKKKKQNVTTLDEWLNSNKSTLETNRQRDLEDNYVQKQLMEKYLAQDMKVSGLNGSGLGELYKQQRNTNYMNDRANINQGYAQQEQDLLNQYYAEKKAQDEEEQQAWYETIYGDSGLASQKIGELDDDGDGKLTDDQMKDLQSYLDGYNGKINPNDAERAGIAIDSYRMINEEKKNKYFEDNYAGLVESTTGIDISTPTKAMEAMDNGSDGYYLYAYQQYFDLKDGDIVQTGLKKSDKYLYYNGKFYKMKKGTDRVATYELNDFQKNGGGSFGGR